ncbi:MAG TPA: hypothetical protein VEL07_15310 [Planctomycetota bacterium]|nr:hypothetical protein [Planctomycetota bacterium]
MRRLAAIAVALLALVGCDLETSYATLTLRSVNGAEVLTGTWVDAFDAKKLSKLSERLDGCDLLVHIATAEAPLDGESAEWIRAWLEAADGRQFVLVLRDGAPSGWLCRRWADEGDAAAAAEGDADDRAPIEAQAKLMRERAAREDEDHAPVLADGERRDDELYTLIGRPPGIGGSLSGLLDGAPPPFMTIGSTPAPGDYDEVLVAVGGAPYAVGIAFGGSRLVLIANATPLLDGALVHRDARRLLDALTTAIGDWRDVDAGYDAALIRRLRVGEGDLPPPNPLAMLFATPPFSYAVYHFLAFAIVLLAWKALWLGRVAPASERPLERFARHVEALAFHLRARRAWRGSLDALARHLRRPAPAPGDAVDAASARAAAAALFAAAPDQHRTPSIQEPR